MNCDESTDRETVFAVKNGPPTTTVVRAVASVEECDPLDLPPLYDSIDTEAMNALANDHRNVDSEIAFTYEGYRIVVRENVEVVIYDAD